MKKKKGPAASALLYLTAVPGMTCLCGAVFLLGQKAGGASGTLFSGGGIFGLLKGIPALLADAARAFPFAEAIRKGSVFSGTASTLIREGTALLVLSCLLVLLCARFKWFRHLGTVINVLLWIVQLALALAAAILAGYGLDRLRSAIPYGSALVIILCFILLAAVLVIDGSLFFIGVLAAGWYLFLASLLLYAGAVPGEGGHGAWFAAGIGLSLALGCVFHKFRN